MDLFSVSGDRCEFPAEIEDTGDKGPRTRGGFGVLRGRHKVSKSSQESHSRGRCESVHLVGSLK